MSVPAIALYAGPPSIPSSSSDHDLSPNPPSSSQKPIIGGLSCLFSSSSIEATSLCHDNRSDDLSSSFSYSSFPSSFKSRDPSPVSVFHGPVSCGGSSKTPPSVRIPRDWGGSEWRAGRDRIFSGFVRNALDSCLDYNHSVNGSGGVGVSDVEELTFDLEESLVGPPPGSEFLARAQSRHKVFYEEVVVKAFYEAEKAHRGQVNDFFMTLDFVVIPLIISYWDQF